MSTEHAVDGMKLFMIPRAERPAYCLQQGRHVGPMLREVPGIVVDCDYCGSLLSLSEISELWPDWLPASPLAPLTEQLAALPLLNEGDSTLSYCARLPCRRYSVKAKGSLLFFPRTGHIMVPYGYRRGGSWDCVVVRGDETYKPTGYSLSVCEEEIETALEVPIDALGQLR